MKGLKSKIITTILDETGIRLHPKDWQITTADNHLSLKLWNHELIRKKYQSEKSLESDEFAEDILTELFDEYLEIRDKIIEIKKEDLNNTFLEDIKAKIIKILKSKKIAVGILDALDFEFTEYVVKGKAPDDWGMPVIGLRITNYESIDYFYNIDLQKEPLVLDEKQIAEDLINKIK
jgi:hypothetical protein